ncbi:hypothetical protein [Brevibacillus massiliensis]|uniref:hypothetical protein n=1 Tax=Brevibacillus massiliensis TaxID=1118054 RepID=UPI0021C4B034|nr:hypothetical protein [Brevibacillus massiliensis]
MDRCSGPDHLLFGFFHYDQRVFSRSLSSPGAAAERRKKRRKRCNQWHDDLILSLHSLTPFAMQICPDIYWVMFPRE